MVNLAPETGLLRKGSIKSYDPITNLITVDFPFALSGGSQSVEVPAPASLFYNNGLFIGSYPIAGTPIIVGQESGGQYHFVRFLVENLPLVPRLNPDELLIYANDNNYIKLDLNNNIKLGSNINYLQTDTSDNFNYISKTFDNNFNFTQVSRKIEGVVRRDLNFNPNYDPNSKLENNSYDVNNASTVIGFDPSATANSIITGATKNPPFNENREIIYEFQYLSNVDNDIDESLLYLNGGINNQKYTFPNRRKSRYDTLSLTLAAPNFLMETVKGTIIDIFGNILDLNRSPLPVGQNQNTIRLDKTTDKIQSFYNIKAIERKSLAYHFELNAKKDLLGNDGKNHLPDINSNNDYSRLRSRFFLDLDKEGQIKLNVPASSEKGNISLLARYENYSTFGTEDNNNPNKLIYREDNLDIFLDSFAAPKATPNNEGFSYSKERGSISIVEDNGANSTPLDRITQNHLKHGTVYHDILQTCYALQNNEFLNYQSGTTKNLTVNLNKIIPLKNVVSDKIIISGTNANAGGRSGSFNFDGSIELNIGANTIDRQSLWLDTAGGTVVNLGRDKNNRSAMITANGDMYLQVGGFGVQGDSRFEQLNNGHYGAVLDLRVMTNGGYTHMLRIDNNGITIMTPGNLAIHSAQDMKISADGNIDIECETLILQQRLVKKDFGGSI